MLNTPRLSTIIIALGRDLIQGLASKEYKWKKKKIHYEKYENEYSLTKWEKINKYNTLPTWK